jgi:hypothetical protein
MSGGTPSFSAIQRLLIGSKTALSGAVSAPPSIRA